MCTTNTYAELFEICKSNEHSSKSGKSDREAQNLSEAEQPMLKHFTSIAALPKKTVSNIFFSLIRWLTRPK